VKVVYLAHPLNAPTRVGIEQNLANAAKWCAWIARQGHAHVCTWITLAGVWDETPENRERGLLIDCALVERCDEVWLVGGRVSTGMAIEADHARMHDKRIVDLTHLGALPPSGRTP